MTTLDPSIESILIDVQLADQRYRLERISAEARAKENTSRDVAASAAERDRLVRVAFDAGAPKLRIGKSIGTKDPGTVNSILARTETMSASTQAVTS